MVYASHKKVIFLITFLLASACSFAQMNWLRNAGSHGNDEALANTIDRSGNIYSTGYFSLSAIFDSIALSSSGGGDVFVLKQNSNGDVTWAVKAGGNGSDRGTSISTDSSGNIYICGYFSGTASFGTTQLVSTNNTQDIFVAKLDAAGNFLWAKKFGGDKTDLALALAVDKNSNVIVSGQFQGNVLFGSTTLTSMINPSTSLPSFDIFLLKLNTAGTFLWVKHGAAKYDDRSLAVATDDSSNIYLTGQFSDTLRFSNTYPNIGYNIGFILKTDASGNDTWFKQMIASYVSVNSITTFGNTIYATGDFQGQLNIQNSPPAIVNNPNLNKIFLLKLSNTGNVIWVKCEGSANAVSSLDIAMDQAGNPYIAGTFRCSFTDYSALYGAAVFYSTGARDIFTAKYSFSGQRVFQRHFAGPRDDYCSAISVFTPNKPVISGSYEKCFNVPKGLNFSFNNANYDSSAYGPVQPFAYCGNAGYNNYLSIASEGFKDIFIAKPVDVSRSPYDYFDRSGSGCNRNILTPYINNNEDTIRGCDHVHLFATRRTGKDGLIGPEYDYHWSNGSTSDATNAYTTGWYYLTIQRKDQCLNAVTDSIYIIIYQSPPVPTVTNIGGIFQTATPVTGCLQKLIVVQPAVASLVGSNFPAGYNYFWATPSGNVYNDTVAVTGSGTYRFFVISPAANCSTSTCVDVLPVTLPATIGLCPGSPVNFVPEIHFTDSIFDLSDTVTVCLNEHFEMVLTDSTLWANHLPSSIFAFVHWQISGGFAFDYYVSYPYTVTNHFQQFLALSTGNCSVTVTIQNPVTGGTCATVTRNFYLIVNPLPPAIAQWTGPSFFCPSDTVLLLLPSGNQYSVSGPDIIWASADSDSVYVNSPGFYSATYTVTNPLTGCTRNGTAGFLLSTSPLPRIKMVPASGIICPNDSIFLTADSGSNYVWYGPLGTPIGNSRSVYVTAPGIYHYTFIDSGGCALVSEFVTLREYSIPSISFYPGNILCQGDSVIMTISEWDTAAVSWLPPLSGNSLTQTVYSPGVYSCQITECGITTVVSVTVSASTISGQIAVSGSQPICPGDTVVLTGPAGMASYQWQPGNLSSSFILVTNPDTYILQVTDFNGCTAGDTVVIAPVSNPSPPSVSDTAICEGDSVLLVASGTGIIRWYAAQNSSTPVFTGSAFQTPALTITTTYYVTNSDSLCQSLRVAVNVFVEPALLAPGISGDTITCAWGTVTLSTNSLSGAAYSWTGPNSFHSSNNPVTITIADSTYTGYYYLSLAYGACTSPTDSIFISLHPPPDFTVTGNIPHCPNDNVLLSGSNTSLMNYLWLPDGQTSHEILVGDRGIFSLIGTNEFGCADTQSVDVTTTMQGTENPWVPNAFTPNDDGKNDAFEITGSLPCDKLTLYIFNRWGEHIYTSLQEHLSWDGRFEGNVVEGGVYVYILEGEHTNIIGSVTVVR